MVAFPPIENYSNFDRPINIITPDPMQFFKELKTSPVPNKRTIPICITAAVYRLSAGNSISSSFNRRQQSDPLQVNKFWTSHSPWDTYRHLFLMRKADDYISSSCSSSSSSSTSSLESSTCSSSRSESPEPSCPTNISAFNDNNSSHYGHNTNNEDDNSSSIPKKHHHHHRHKKRSCHMLLREIRRLRGENDSLRTSVSVLKNDLRDINLSRQYTDASHKKFYDEYIDKNTQLEIDIMDRDDEIKKLKEEIARLKAVIAKQQQKHQQDLQRYNVIKSTEPPTSPFSALSTAATSTVTDAHAKDSNSVTNEFACLDYFDTEDMNEDILSCESIATTYDSAIPGTVIEASASASPSERDEQEEINAYFRRRMMDLQNEDNSDDENDRDISDTNQCNSVKEEHDEGEDYEPELEPFETVAPSYIHQAILSKLSSTRVRLEFDDLILKYEPTVDMITQVLAVSFAQWMHTILTKNIDKDALPPVTPARVFGTKIHNGIVDFWQAILQFYTTEEESQLLFLNHLDTAVTDKLIIVNNFDRLIFMLYKYNVIDDDAALDWWHHPFDNDASKNIRAVTHKFAEWLEEDDKDEDDDEDCCSDSDSEEEDDTTQNTINQDTNNCDTIDQANDSYDSDDQRSLRDNDDEANFGEEACCTDEVLHDGDIPEDHFSFDETFSDEDEVTVPVIEKKKKTVRICV